MVETAYPNTASPITKTNNMTINELFVCNKHSYMETMFNKSGVKTVLKLQVLLDSEKRVNAKRISCFALKFFSALLHPTCLAT